MTGWYPRQLVYRRQTLPPLLHGYDGISKLQPYEGTAWAIRLIRASTRPPHGKSTSGWPHHKNRAATVTWLALGIRILLSAHCRDICIASSLVKLQTNISFVIGSFVLGDFKCAWLLGEFSCVLYIWIYLCLSPRPFVLRFETVRQNVMPGFYHIAARIGPTQASIVAVFVTRLVM